MFVFLKGMNTQILSSLTKNTFYTPTNLSFSPCLPRFISHLNLPQCTGYNNGCFKSMDSLINHSQNDYSINFKVNNILKSSINQYSTHKTRVTWDDYEDIAELLFEKYKSTNPLSLRFTDLHEMVKEVVMGRFSVEVSGEVSEGALEKIQMTWLELYEED